MSHLVIMKPLRLVNVFTIAIAISSTAAVADSVVWDYDLTECPPNWIAESEWRFRSYGMKCYFSFGWGKSNGGCVYTDEISIPPTTDSLTMVVHSEYIGVSNNTNLGAHIDFGSDETGWIYLWTISGEQVDSTLISVTITDFPENSPGRIRFVGWGSTGGGSSGTGSVEWTLRDLVLTAHFPYEGIPGLEWSTWGVIKTMLVPSYFPIDEERQETVNSR